MLTVLKPLRVLRPLSASGERLPARGYAFFQVRKTAGGWEPFQVRKPDTGWENFEVKNG
jgi:hypothetical protein